MRTPMIDEHNLVPFGRFDGDDYKSSQAAERTPIAASGRITWMSEPS